MQRRTVRVLVGGDHVLAGRKNRGNRRDDVVEIHLSSVTEGEDALAGERGKVAMVGGGGMRKLPTMYGKESLKV
jgi:hypothetical protein